MNRWTPATLIVLGVSSIALAGEGSEKPVKPSDLPAAVTASVQQHYPGATIHEASQETREGVRTWEAGISIGNRNLDLAFADDGTLKEEEEKLDPSALPDPIKKAIGREAPGGSVTKAERAVAHGKTHYEVDVKVKGKSTELVLDEAGTVVKNHGDEEADEEGEDDEKE